MIDHPRMVLQCVKLQSAAAKKRVGSERRVYRGCEVGGVDVFPLLNTHG